MVLAFIFIILASVIGIFLPLWEARGIFLKVRLLLILRHLNQSDGLSLLHF